MKVLDVIMFSEIPGDQARAVITSGLRGILILLKKV